ncbi:MAG: hypothetical protein R3E89_13640 [Thiolinea sp.]
MDKPEFKSGIRAGNGRNRQDCEKNALRGVERDGWEITFSRIVDAGDRQRNEREPRSERRNRNRPPQR